jgi:signal transduction histidine kinase
VTRRVFAALVGVTTLAIVLFAVPLAVVVARVDREQRVLVLQREGTSAAVLIPDDRRQGEPVTMGKPPEGGHLGFYEKAGGLAAGTGPASADDVTITALSGGSADADVGGELVAAVPVSDDQRVIGAVRIAEPAQVVTDEVREAWSKLALLAVGIVVVAAVVALALAKRLAAPWRSLERRAGRLGDGDFTTSGDLTGIAEVDRASGALDETSARLAALVERERQFSADASHQLRTPLTGLKVIIESELVRPRDDPSVALDAALQQVDRLEATIDSLLSAARDDPRQRHPLDLVALLADARRRWKGEAADRGRSVGLNVETGLSQPVASQTVIEHVVDVLISNALEHGAGRVDLAAGDVAGGGVAITVSDGGGLIADPDALFRRRDDSAAGHGIGLALARALTVAEGGLLRLRENRDARTTFELLLPISSGEVDPVPEPTVVEPASMATPVTP